MGSHRNRIHVLDAQEVERYMRTGIHPSCLNHEHVSLNKALELTGELLYSVTIRIGDGIGFRESSVYEYDWVLPVVGDKGFKAITNSAPRHWVIRKSGGMDVHQLVKG